MATVTSNRNDRVLELTIEAPPVNVLDTANLVQDLEDLLQVVEIAHLDHQGHLGHVVLGDKFAADDIGINELPYEIDMVEDEDLFDEQSVRTSLNTFIYVQIVYVQIFTCMYKLQNVKKCNNFY